MNNAGLSQHAPEWMVVYITYSLYEAQIVAGHLEAEGIPNLVHQQAGASAMGIHIGRLGEVTVLVRPQDYDTAQVLVYTDEPDALPDDIDQIIFDDDESDE